MTKRNNPFSAAKKKATKAGEKKTKKPRKKKKEDPRFSESDIEKSESGALVKSKPLSKAAKKTRTDSFLGTHVPPRECDNCDLTKSCPLYKPGFECAFTSAVESKPVENEDDLIDAIKSVVSLQLSRAQFLTIAENITGSHSDELDKVITSTGFLAKDLHTMMKERKGGSRLNRGEIGPLQVLFSTTYNSQQNNQGQLDVVERPVIDFKGDEGVDIEDFSRREQEEKEMRQDSRDRRKQFLESTKV